LPSTSKESFGIAFSYESVLPLRTSPHEIKVTDPLIQWFKSHDELLMRPGESDSLQAVSGEGRQVLQKIGAGLSVPIKTQDGELAGVLVLRPKTSQKDYSSRDRQLLVRRARQIAMTLKNALQYRALNESYGQLAATHEQGLKAERIKALRQMTRGVCHSFNNSFTGILGHTQLALDIVQDEKVKRHLDLVEHSTAEATEIIHKLQDFSQDLPVAIYRPLDVNQLVKDSLTLIQPILDKRREGGKPPIDVSLELGTVGQVQGSDKELKELLVNLLTNALEAIPEQGRISLKTEQHYTSILISVTDTGTGMTPETQSRLFEPFFTTKGRHGRGLGLSTAYGIVKRHGGDISVSSKSETGSILRITLPSASINPGETPTPSSIETASRRENSE
jgi:signal transduction histidine kinase